MHRFNACYLAKLSFKVPRCTLRPFDNTLLVIDVFLCSVSYKGSLRFLNHLTGRSPSHPDPPPFPRQVMQTDETVVSGDNIPLRDFPLIRCTLIPHTKSQTRGLLCEDGVLTNTRRM